MGLASYKDEGMKGRKYEPKSSRILHATKDKDQLVQQNHTMQGQ